MSTTTLQVDVRYCVLDLQGGQITIKVKANNGLRTGTKFALWEKNAQGDWVKYKEYELSTGDSGSASVTLDEDVSTLERHGLNWLIQVCSFIPGVENGVIRMSIEQDNGPCQITKPLEWSRTNLQNCETGELKQISSSLQFLFK